MFSRRAIQRMLNENAAFTTKNQFTQVLGRLNGRRLQSLEAEWEVAVLNAFSKLGDVLHEPPLDGPSKIDLLFTCKDSQTFLADIACVSDEGYERKREAVRKLYSEFEKRLEAAGMMQHRWTVTLGPRKPVGPGSTPRLSIPLKSDFDSKVFNADFHSFLESVGKEPGIRKAYLVTIEDTVIALIYEPNGVGFFTDDVTLPNRASLKNKNPVFNQLKSKADQLKKAKYGGAKGIVLCDSGSHMMNSPPHGAFEFDFNAADAVKDFLRQRQHQSIAFVLLLSSVGIDEGRLPRRKPPFRRVQATLITNPFCADLPNDIRKALERVDECFPEPLNTPYGARETIKLRFDPKKLRPLGGGWEVSDKRIKISESAVLGLLAGLVSQDELFESLGFTPQSSKLGAIQNPFGYMARKKMRIASVQVEETSHDDNYLVFDFEGPDPAVSQFTNPKA